MDIPNVKSTKESLPFTVDPIGFENKINYAALYHLYMQKLNDIHATEGVVSSVTYYNTMVVPSFGGMFDEIFLKNCVEIIEKNGDDFNAIYMLHKVELNRLMTRIGVAPKPDIRIRYEGTWEVPTSIDEMSFDGKKKYDKKSPKVKTATVCGWMRC